MTSPIRINLLAVLSLALLGQIAQAQPVYKIVGPDGKVTFSDKPPPSNDKGKVATQAGPTTGGVASGDLPYELRQVVNKYPVTLYSAVGCAPCDAGRGLLKSRGVPFTERTITTPEDQEALNRLAGDNNLPYATIGSQRLKGFSDLEWSQYLDAAGYPTSSALPKSYRYPAPTPLVAVQKQATPTAAPAAPKPVEPAPAPTSPSAPSPSNPAGITF